MIKQNIKNKSEKIFPDKLLNLHKYKIVIGVNTADSLVIVERNESGHAIGVLKALYNETRLILESMNFSINLFEAKEKKYATGLNFLIEKLRNNEISLIAVPRGYHIVYENITHAYTEEDCFKISALIPEEYKNQIEFPKKMITSLLVFPAFLGLIVWILKLMNIFSQKISVLKILGALFGITVSLKPSKNSDLITLSCIFIISTIYPTDFFSQFVDMKLIQRANTFDTFKSIVESNLGIFIFKMYEQNIQEINDMDAIQIKKRSMIYNDPRDCVNKLLTDRNLLCIGAYDTFAYLLQVIGKREVHRTMFAEQIFGCLPRSYLFERASPYAKRFQNKLRQLHECGIDMFIRKHFDEFKDKHGKNSYALMSDQFHINLIFIVACGMVLSLIVFLIERLLNHIVVKARKFNFSRLTS
ncbi:hypothetical protein TKK_0007199 [Trichogramma kaykai]